jgi:hypothetical protein
MGMEENENFVIHKKPPDEWGQPYIPISGHKNVISFENGCVMPILSLEVEGPANGLNLQALLGDEAKFYKKAKVKEIIRTIRGGKKEWKQLPEYGSQWFFTDKYGGDIEWILNKRKLVDLNKIKAILKLQDDLDQLIKTNGSISLVEKYTGILNKSRQSLVFVSEASAE